MAGLIAAVLLVVALFLLSSLPAPGSPGRAIIGQLRTGHAVTLAASYAGVLASVTMVPFVASLRAFTVGPDGESEWRWTVTLLGAAAAVSLILVGTPSWPPPPSWPARYRMSQRCGPCSLARRPA